MKSQRKIGMVLSTMQIFVSSVVGLLFTPFLIKSLGEVEYGLYQLLYATIGYLALLDFGLGSTITQFVLKGQKGNEEQRVSSNSVITMCLKIYGVVITIILVLTVLVANNLKFFYPATITSDNFAYARELFMVMGVTTVITLFSHALSGIETAYEQYIVTKGVRLLQQIIRVVVLVVLFCSGMKALAIVYVDLVLAVFLLLFDILYCKFKLHINFGEGRWDTELFKRISKFSVFVFLQIIVTQINNSVDRVLLGRYASLQLVGLYAVAMQLYNMFNSFGGVIPGVSIPQISRLVYSGATDDEVTDYCASISRLQFLVLMMMTGGFALYGKHFVSCWTSEYNNHQVWIITLLIILPQVFEFIETPIFYVMKAKELQGVRSIILSCVAAGNIVISLIFLKISPTYGCAWGTFISFIVGNNILANIYYHKKVGINIPRYLKALFKGLLPAWLISLVIGGIINVIPGQGWGSLLLKCVLYVGVYVGLMCSFGLNKAERGLILTPIMKLRERRNSNE